MGQGRRRPWGDVSASCGAALTGQDLATRICRRKQSAIWQRKHTNGHPRKQGGLCRRGAAAGFSARRETKLQRATSQRPDTRARARARAQDQMRMH